MMMAITMDTILYSARIESRVLRVPVPAINGNARGITEAVLFEISSFEIFTPKIISKAIMKSKIEPAIAKSPIWIPIISKIEFPTNKKTIIIANETQEAFIASMVPVRSFTPIIMGMEPMMSITANNTMVTLRISIMSKFRFRVIGYKLSVISYQLSVISYRLTVNG